MKITIQPLSPALIHDYFDFFDHRAFVDGSPFYPCYCNAFNLSAEAIRNDLLAQATDAESWRMRLRESAWRMVQAGDIQGYLAYDGDVAVGWCNANDRMNYARVGEFDLERVPEDAPPKDCPGKGIVKSIVCFEIAPDYRGKGIATLLLKRVCADAKAAGYACVEGYPQVCPQSAALAFTGPMGLYLKAGFAEYSRKENRITMRKKI